MKSFTLKNILAAKKLSYRGFILPFTMLISVLVLLVTSTSMTLLSKQLYFSKLYRQSQSAYYAADDALACTLTIDDAYQGSDGLGIFPSDSSFDTVTYMSNVVAYINAKRVAIDPAAEQVSLDGAVPIIAEPIKCGQAAIFQTGPSSYSKFATSTYEYEYIDIVTSLPGIEQGISSTFTMRMDLGVDPTAPVAVPLTHAYRCAKVTVNKTASFRQIIAQGYSSCDKLNNSVERAVVNTTRY